MSFYSLDNEKQQVYVLGPVDLSTLMCPGYIKARLSDSQICSHAAGQHRVDQDIRRGKNSMLVY